MAKFGTSRRIPDAVHVCRRPTPARNRPSPDRFQVHLPTPGRWAPIRSFRQTGANIKDFRRAIPVNDRRDFTVSGESYSKHIAVAKSEFFTFLGVGDQPGPNLALAVESHDPVAGGNTGHARDDG